MEIWSNTLAPYECLLDSQRTTAFRHAILTVVKPNEMLLGATNELNGDKILPIRERTVTCGEPSEARITYEMGRGLASLSLSYPADATL